MDVSTHRTFDIGHCLGKGGFGEVYRATMSSSGGLSREVAIKLLRADLDMHDDAVRRLRDEGRLLAGLDHPALLKVYDLVELAGRVALITEFIDGEDLTECFRARPAMPPRALVEAIGRVADALHVAWTAPLGPNGRALRLVHRDIKPSNLRIGRHGQVKVLDFGIARSDEVARESRTSTDLIIGSPAYMAPERFLDNEVRSASDVFALGCCLYEGLTGGERLFGGQSAMVLSTLALDRSRFDAFLSDRPLPDGLPSELLELVQACLQHDPTQRPTAQQLARRCEELADELPGASLSRWARSREWPTGAVGVPSSLVGQVVTEGSLALAREDSGAASTARSGSMAVFMGSAALGVVAVGVVVLLATVGVGVAWQQGVFDGASATEPVEEAPVAAVPVPVTEPIDTGGSRRVEPEPDPEPIASAPTPDPVPVSTPPRPEPEALIEVAPEPEPAVEVAPEPEPPVEVAPEPVAPAPRPVPAPVPTGTVSVQGSMSSVWLTSGSQRIDLTAGGVAVPEGRWTLRSQDSVNGTAEHGTVRVTAGASLTVSCSQSMASCRTR